MKKGFDLPVPPVKFVKKRKEVERITAEGKAAASLDTVAVNCQLDENQRREANCDNYIVLSRLPASLWTMIVWMLPLPSIARLERVCWFFRDHIVRTSFFDRYAERLLLSQFMAYRGDTLTSKQMLPAIGNFQLRMPDVFCKVHHSFQCHSPTTMIRRCKRCKVEQCRVHAKYYLCPTCVVFTTCFYCEETVPCELVTSCARCNVKTCPSCLTPCSDCGVRFCKNCVFYGDDDEGLLCAVCCSARVACNCCKVRTRPSKCSKCFLCKRELCGGCFSSPRADSGRFESVNACSDCLKRAWDLAKFSFSDPSTPFEN